MNKDVFGKRMVDVKVVKFVLCWKLDLIDCKYGLRKGILRDFVKNNLIFKIIGFGL